MSIETILKIIGWAMTIIPLTAFLIVSGHMFLGAAKDDEAVMAIVLLAITIFAVGAGILVMVYFTGLLPGLLAG